MRRSIHLAHGGYSRRFLVNDSDRAFLDRSHNFYIDNSLLDCQADCKLIVSPAHPAVYSDVSDRCQSNIV